MFWAKIKAIFELSILERLCNNSFYGLIYKFDYFWIIFISWSYLPNWGGEVVSVGGNVGHWNLGYFIDPSEHFNISTAIAKGGRNLK